MQRRIDCCRRPRSRISSIPEKEKRQAGRELRPPRPRRRGLRSANILDGVRRATPSTRSPTRCLPSGCLSCSRQATTRAPSLRKTPMSSAARSQSMRTALYGRMRDPGGSSSLILQTGRLPSMRRRPDDRNDGPNQPRCSARSPKTILRQYGGILQLNHLEPRRASPMGFTSTSGNTTLRGRELIEIAN